MGSALRVATVQAQRGQRAFAAGWKLRNALEQIAIGTSDGFHGLTRDVNGMMEWWENGILFGHYSNIPSFQSYFSAIPYSPVQR